MTTLSLPPSVNAMYRFGKGRMYKTQEATDWLTEAVLRLRTREKTKYLGSVGMVIGFYFKDNRRHDIDNCLEALLDAYVHAKIIPDDSYVSDINVHKRFSKEAPRVEIELYETHAEG